MIFRSTSVWFHRQLSRILVRKQPGGREPGSVTPGVRVQGLVATCRAIVSRLVAKRRSIQRELGASASGMLVRSATVWIGALVSTVAVGGLMAWGSLAPLAEGVVVYGKVSVERERKVIQHLEGGIIQDVLIAEGDRVVAGQPLLILADVSVAAGRDQVALELVDAMATINRLDTLLIGGSALEFQDFSEFAIGANDLQEITTKQTELFEQQKASLRADIGVLQARREGLYQQVAGLADRIENAHRAKALLVSEIDRNTALLDQGLVRADLLNDLKQRAIELDAELIELNAQKVLSDAKIAEIHQQIAQVQARTRKDISDELVEWKARSRSLAEQLVSAQDVVNRTVISAPHSGAILNLVHTTKGGVVRPGEPILEIIPDTDGLIVSAEIRPIDRDSVVEGQYVEARLSGSNSWNSVLLPGTVEQISADLKSSPRGDYHFYEATIVIDAQGMDGLTASPVPGMPVEAFVYSGNSRTFLNYLVEPVSASLRRGLRE